MTYPEPELPGNRESWREAFSTFLVKYKHHHDLLLPSQAERMFEHFLQHPITLKPDEMALVLSILALGKLADSHLGRDEDTDIAEEVAFFRLGWSAIESCEQASQTGISESPPLQPVLDSKLRLIPQGHCTCCIFSLCRLGVHKRSQLYWTL